MNALRLSGANAARLIARRLRSEVIKPPLLQHQTVGKFFQKLNEARF